MSNNKKRRISSDVILVVIGVAAILSLQQCDPDDNCRYVYRSLPDCETDWGYGACRQQGVKYYGPEQKQCDSSGKTSGGSGGGSGTDPDGKGEHAIGVERGGFGGASRGGG